MMNSVLLRCDVCLQNKRVKTSLTAVCWTKMHEPWLTANGNGSGFCTACYHRVVWWERGCKFSDKI